MLSPLIVPWMVKWYQNTEELMIKIVLDPMVGDWEHPVSMGSNSPRQMNSFSPTLPCRVSESLSASSPTRYPQGKTHTEKLPMGMFAITGLALTRRIGHRSHETQPPYDLQTSLSLSPKFQTTVARVRTSHHAPPLSFPPKTAKTIFCLAAAATSDKGGSKKVPQTSNDQDGWLSGHE